MEDIKKTVKKKRKQLRLEFKVALELATEVTTSNIESLLDHSTINMLPGYQKTDIVHHNFEFHYERFSMWFFGTDATGQIITENTFFLSSELKEYFVISDKLEVELDELEEMYKKKNKWENMTNKHNLKLYEIYENWFEACWLVAKEKTGCTLLTYLSIEQLDLGMELTNMGITEFDKSHPEKRRYIE